MNILPGRYSPTKRTTTGRITHAPRIVTAISGGQVAFYPEGQDPAARRVRVGAGFAGIDEVVRWAATSRGGRQFDMERAIPSPACSSRYGLCE
jgi:hypothetical protein